MDVGLVGPVGCIVTGQVTLTAYDLTRWVRGHWKFDLEAEVLMAF